MKEITKERVWSSNWQSYSGIYGISRHYYGTNPIYEDDNNLRLFRLVVGRKGYM